MDGGGMPFSLAAALRTLGIAHRSLEYVDAETSHEVASIRHGAEPILGICIGERVVLTASVDVTLEAGTTLDALGEKGFSGFGNTVTLELMGGRCDARMEFAEESGKRLLSRVVVEQTVVLRDGSTSELQRLGDGIIEVKGALARARIV